MTDEGARRRPRGGRRGVAGRAPQIQEWFERFGDDLPAVLWTELDGLRNRLGNDRPARPAYTQGPSGWRGPWSSHLWNHQPQQLTARSDGRGWSEGEGAA